jgi:excisionase family DNA binding protein
MAQQDEVTQLFDRKKLITPNELAEMLNVSIRTIRHMIKEGHIPAFKVGKQWRAEPSVVLKHLKEKGIA